MDILNLSRLKIYGILESEHDLQIQVKITSPPSSCPHCGCVATFGKPYPMFKIPPIYVRDQEERKNLGMDLPTLIEKLEKGQL